MLAGIHWLLNAAALPPEVDAAIGDNHQAFITGFYREGHRYATAALEYDRHIEKQWQWRGLYIS
ncbi:hypothetical protein GCM10027094_18710 [Hafnia psychrotolerans]